MNKLDTEQGEFARSLAAFSRSGLDLDPRVIEDVGVLVVTVLREAGIPAALDIGDDGPVGVVFRRIDPRMKRSAGLWASEYGRVALRPSSEG